MLLAAGAGIYLVKVLPVTDDAVTTAEQVESLAEVASDTRDQSLLAIAVLPFEIFSRIVKTSILPTAWLIPCCTS